MSLSVDIKKRRANFLLDVRFSAENEIMGVLGASGCGKSMTLKCIAGIETPDAGRIVLGGKVLFDSDQGVDLPPQARGVGYLFQNYALFPHMTVAENIEAGMKPGAKRGAASYLRVFYLDGLGSHYPAQLSGGQQQRAALARIFASEPEILMLDEPFSALDSCLKWQVELELAKILERYPKTVLFVSHDRNEVYRFCDRVAVLSDGRLEGVKAKQALFDAPETLAESKLSGCKNHSRAAVLNERRVYASDWGLELDLAAAAAEEIRYVGIRAHDINITDEPTRANAFPCAIVNVVEELFGVVLMARYRGAPRALRVEMEKDAWRKVDPNKRTLYVELPPERLFTLKKSKSYGDSSIF